MPTPESDDDPRVRALEEGAGYSHFDAEHIVLGEPTSSPAVQHGPHASQPVRKRYARTPFADGDSAMDPNWNPPYVAESLEERTHYAEVSRRGHAFGTELLARQRRDSIINDPDLNDNEKVQKLADLQIKEKARRQRRGEE